MSRKPKARGAALAIPGKKTGLLGGRTFKVENFKLNLKALRYGMDNLGGHVRKSVTLMDAILSYLEDNPGTNWDAQVEDAQLNTMEKLTQIKSTSLAKGVIDLLQTPPVQELLGEVVKVLRKRAEYQAPEEIHVASTPTVTQSNLGYNNLPKAVRGIQL